MTAKMKTTGLKAAAKKSDKVFKAMDLSRVNRAASIFLDVWVQRNFKTEGGKVGGWVPFLYGGRLTPKKRGGVKGSEGKYINPSAALLRDSGELRMSFKPFHNKVSAGIGSGLPRAKVHDQGEGNAIQRRMLPEDNEVQGELRRLYGTHVRTALNA